jgi:histidinol-phosphate aminotransferase
MSRFLSQRFADLEAYTPGEQPQDMEYVKLNTNESPFPPSPAVLAAVNAYEVGRLNLYPDPECKNLRRKLAKLYGVGEENVFLSNGSDDILNFAFMAFCDDSRPVAFPALSYGFYPVYANLYRLPYEAIPLREGFVLAAEDYCSLGKNIVLANPNAPTGRIIPVSDIEKILRTNPDHVVVVDEAYIDFGGESCRKLLPKYENLLVCQTFSKSRSMAGGRLGFALGSKGLIEDLNKIKYSTNPYNINRLTQIAAEAAVDSNDYYVQNCKVIEENRAYTVAELDKLGFETLPSMANFIFTRRPGTEGNFLYRSLKQRGVLVRHWDKPEIQDYLRITIGSKAQMDALLQTLKQILREVT